MEHTLTIAVLDHLHDLSLHRDTPSGGAQDYSDALRKFGPQLEEAARAHLEGQHYWEQRIREMVTTLVMRLNCFSRTAAILLLSSTLSVTASN